MLLSFAGRPIGFVVMICLDVVELRRSIVLLWFPGLGVHSQECHIAYEDNRALYARLFLSLIVMSEMVVPRCHLSKQFVGLHLVGTISHFG